MNLLCWNCGESLDDVPRPISRHATCASCFNELHCCRLCRHYDAKRSMQCFEDRADPPLQKENANFCDFFSPSAHAFDTQTVTKSDDARDRLSALFGENEDAEDAEAGPIEESAADPAPAEQPESLSPEEIARKKLDDLFG